MNSTTKVADALGAKSHACAVGLCSRKRTPRVNGRAVLVALILVLFAVLEMLFTVVVAIHDDEGRSHPPRLESHDLADTATIALDEVSATERAVYVSPVHTR